MVGVIQSSSRVVYLVLGVKKKHVILRVVQIPLVDSFLYTTGQRHVDKEPQHSLTYQEPQVRTGRRRIFGRIPLPV